MSLVDLAKAVDRALIEGDVHGARRVLATLAAEMEALGLSHAHRAKGRQP